MNATEERIVGGKGNECNQDSLGKSINIKAVMFLYTTVSVLRTLTREPSTETNIKRTGSIEPLVAGRWLAEEPAAAVASWRPWRTSCWTCWDPSASVRLPEERRTETWP